MYNLQLNAFCKKAMPNINVFYSEKLGSTLITAKPVPSHNTSVHFTDVAQFTQWQNLA